MCFLSLKIYNCSVEIHVKGARGLLVFYLKTAQVYLSVGTLFPQKKFKQGYLILS